MFKKFSKYQSYFTGANFQKIAYTYCDPRHLGAAQRAQQKGRRTKRAQSKKGAEQKGREITMLRHRYIQGRNFFR